MAKNLNFTIGGENFPLAPTKVERKKLYGWTETRVTDQQGNPCRQAGLESNGVTIVPKGATKMGMLREDGLWMEKDELTARHSDGTPAQMLPSSFDYEIALDTEVSDEYVLDLCVTAVYQLEGETAANLAALIKDKQYAFKFNYRSDYEEDDAVLLCKGDTPFVLVGKKAEFTMIGLDEQGVIDEPDDEVSSEEEELDFSMF